MDKVEFLKIRRLHAARAGMNERLGVLPLHVRREQRKQGEGTPQAGEKRRRAGRAAGIEEAVRRPGRG